MTHEDWGGLLRIAVTRFSVTPVDFWQISVWEWRQMMGKNRLEHAGNAKLKELLAQFPDLNDEEIKNGSK